MTLAASTVEAPRFILAPYVATPREVVERMLDLAGITAADVVYDLGCGDGRIAIAAAKRGARGFGVDIEPHWVEEARRNAADAGVSHLVSFEVEDALAVDLSPATVVMLYLVEWSTRKLGAKLESELQPGARVVSHSFAIGDRPPERTEQWIDAAGQPRTLRLWRTGSVPAVDSLGKMGIVPPDDSRETQPDVSVSSMEISGLTLDRLRQLVGSTFQVALPTPWDLRLELSEASPLAAMTAPPGASRAPFRLIFHGPATPVHPQSILPLEHEGLGRIEIFLVPIGPDARGMQYEAIFT